MMLSALNGHILTHKIANQFIIMNLLNIFYVGLRVFIFVTGEVAQQGAWDFVIEL